MSKLNGILAASAVLSSNILVEMPDNKKRQPFLGLHKPNTRGIPNGIFDLPKPKLQTKMVRSGTPLSLRKRKKLLARITAK